jgi:hypothetical protein
MYRAGGGHPPDECRLSEPHLHSCFSWFRLLRWWRRLRRQCGVAGEAIKNGCDGKTSSVTEPLGGRRRRTRKRETNLRNFVSNLQVSRGHFHGSVSQIFERKKPALLMWSLNCTRCYAYIVNSWLIKKFDIEKTWTRQKKIHWKETRLWNKYLTLKKYRKWKKVKP